MAILGGGDLWERKMGQKLDMKMTFLLRFTGTQFCHPQPAPIRSSLHRSHTHLRGDKSLVCACVNERQKEGACRTHTRLHSKTKCV